MKKRKIIAIVAALMLCALPAMAAGVSGSIAGRAIEVRWQCSAGECELTVYQNDWPICIRRVSGGSGSLSVPIDDPSGSYALRLNAPEGCYTAKVQGAKPTEVPVATPEPTAVPAPEPTEPPVMEPVATPTAQPTEQPTAQPTEQPTAQPTAKPTEQPTAKPTEQPTAKPTEQPTAKPTVKPTAQPTVMPTAQPTKAPVSVDNRDDLATQVLNLVNQERASRGLGALRMDSELTRAACVRAGEIVQSFSHTRPDGSAWSTVSSSAYGENIAKGQQTAEKVVAAWMTSTGHRENILRASYGSIGICAYRVNGVMYWVQLFGK